MKNLTVLLLFFFCSIQLFSQLKPEASLELGYEDRVLKFRDKFGVVHSSNWLNDKEFAKIDLGVKYKKLLIYTDVKTYFAYEKFYQYTPFQAEYKVGMQYQIKCFSFRAEHMCSHSIEREMFQDAYDRFSVVIKLF